jgi:hypothetical protein
VLSGPEEGAVTVWGPDYPAGPALLAASPARRINVNDVDSQMYEESTDPISAAAQAFAGD